METKTKPLKRLFTVGYQKLGFYDLVKILTDAEVSTLVDVRSMPFSRWKTDFNRDKLYRDFPQHGIKYVWRGDTLGGKSGVRLPGYAEALEWLIRLCETEKPCVMCMEQDPSKCHRDMWIASDVLMKNVQVTHLGWVSVEKKDTSLLGFC